MSSSGNVAHVQPPAPPGPAGFDYGRFTPDKATKIVDTQQLSLNANTLNVCRGRFYGDPADPLAPAVSAPALATQILYAPYFDSSNVAQFNPTVLLGNTCTYFTENLFAQRSVRVVASMLVGESNIPPGIPTWSLVQKGSLSVKPGASLGSQVGNGVIVGPGVLYCDGPRPGLPTSGAPLLDLDGGSIYGSATVYA